MSRAFVTNTFHYDNPLYFQASVITDNDENFQINGVVRHSDEASTSVADLCVTDGENGDMYRILNVPIEVFPYTNPITKVVYNHIRLNHSTIKFETKDILIGDKAELEIRQNLGAIDELELPRPLVHIGTTSIKIVVAQKIEPGFRRESHCESSPLPILEQSEDFLV